VALPTFADTGFAILPRLGWSSLAIGVGAGLAFGCLMVLADGTVFATVVPAVQRDILASGGFGARLVLFMRGSLLDELALRLVALPLTIWTIMALTGRRGSLAAWPAILLVSCVFWPIWASAYMRDLEPSALTLTREVVLHMGAGTVWGWLCWRHGWLTGLAGHWSAHVALQALLPLTV